MENLFDSRSLSKSLRGQISDQDWGRLWGHLHGPHRWQLRGLMPGDPLRIWDTQGPPRRLEGEFWSPFRGPLLAQLNEDWDNDG